jgi:D,D-heptose 1,7-bisphosphate phosphatase
MNRAVFLDRDGVINELIYHTEHGIIDSPFTAKQFKLLPGVGTAVERLNRLGFLVILVSNQPGMAKGHFSSRTFQSICRKMVAELARHSAHIDAEYYCLHHPQASVQDLKKDCECRKPKPGLLLKAAVERDIDLSASWMIGDGLTDIQAGMNAGTKTILIGNMKCEICHKMDELKVHPYIIMPDLLEVTKYLERI